MFLGCAEAIGVGASRGVYTSVALFGIEIFLAFHLARVIHTLIGRSLTLGALVREVRVGLQAFRYTIGTIIIGAFSPALGDKVLELLAQSEQDLYIISVARSVLGRCGDSTRSTARATIEAKL